MTEVIDAWMQHPNEVFANSEIFSSLRRWTGNDDMIQQALSLDFLDVMYHEVDIAFCSAWMAPKGKVLISNEQVLQVCQHDPSKYRGMLCCSIDRPMEAVREIEHYMTHHGELFVGYRFLPWLWELPLTHRLVYSIVPTLIKHSLPLCIQLGQTGPMCTSQYGRPIPYLETLLLDFPELVVVGGHIGSPWINEVLFLLEKFPNLYIDTSAYMPKVYPAELVRYMKTKRGRKRVLFGSNYPMIPPFGILNEINSLELDAETSDLFLGGNARRVFKRLPPKKLAKGTANL